MEFTRGMRGAESHAALAAGDFELLKAQGDLDGAEQLLTAPGPNAVRACAPLPWLHFARAASTCRARCRRLSGG